MLDALLPTAGEDDLRGFEWYFLRRLCDRGDRLLRSGGKRIASLCVHENGEVLVSRDATYSQHAVARYRDGKPVAGETMDVHDHANGFSFSPRSHWCAAVLTSGAVELRDWRTPAETVAQIAPPGGHEVCAAISADGSLVAWTASGQPLAVWSVTERRQLKSIAIDVKLPADVKLSADGKWAAVLGPSDCLLVRLADETVRAFTVPAKSILGAVAFSPDSQKIAVAFTGGEVEVYSLATGKRQFAYNVLKQRIYATCMTFLAGSQRLAIGSNNSLLVEFDLEKSAAHVHRGHTDGVTSLATGSDPNRLYSGSRNGEVLEWDLAVEDQRATVIRDRSPEGDAMGFDALAYSPDGKLLACGGRSLAFDDKPEYGMVLLIDPATRKVTGRIASAEPVSTCSFSPDGTQLVYGDANSGPKSFHLWHVPGAANMNDVTLPGGAFSACFAPDGRVVLGGGDARLYAVNLAGEREIWTPAVTNPQWAVRSVADLVATPGGSRILSCSEASIIRLWNGVTGEELARSVGHLGRTPLALSADGRFAAWTTPNRELVHSESAGGVESSPETQIDGPIAAHHRAIVYDIAARRILFVVAGHASPIDALALSADGRRLASGDNSGILKLWDVASGNELISFNAHINGVRALAFHPRGRQLASIGSDATTKIWRGE
jgi:WD40 repeat protein